MQITAHVPKVCCPDPEEFQRQYAQRAQPVVLTGVVESWPAMQKWNRGYFTKTIGDVMVSVRHSPSHIHPDFDRLAETSRLEMTYGAYLDLIHSGTEEQRAQYYASGVEAELVAHGRENPDLCKLLDDCGRLPYLEWERLHTSALWVSAKGVSSWMHFDDHGCHNLNVQVRGRKEVLLFDPNQLDKLYPFPSHERPGVIGFSAVSVNEPDYLRFPRFREARAQKAILDEGDVLFLPAFWFHFVQHVGDFNVNVNFFWRQPEVQLSRTSFLWGCRLAVLGIVQARVRAKGGQLRGNSAALLREFETDPLLGAALMQFESISVSDALAFLDRSSAAASASGQSVGSGMNVV